MRASGGDPGAAAAFYGSDREGLVWAYRFEPGQPACAVAADAAAACLAGDAGGAPAFLWLHFSTSNTGSERWLRANHALPDAFYTAFRQVSGSTRVERDGDQLVGVFHDLQLELGKDRPEVSTVSLSVD